MASTLLCLIFGLLIVSTLNMCQYLSGRSRAPLLNLVAAFATVIGALLAALFLVKNYS